MPTPVQIQQHFDNWVAFFVDFIGSKIERLNGLQFNLDNPGAGGGVNPMRDQLGDLADALGMTLTNSVSEPNELYWPLAGPYKITWDVPEAQKIGFDSLVLDLFFENEPDYRMVVNCSVELTVTIPGAGAPVSSSSSYVATSSSG